MHPQTAAALRLQRRSPLTIDNLPAVRESMRAATLDEVGPGPSVPVTDVPGGRRYGDGGPGVIVYAHGGGWALGDLDTHDGLCRTLSDATGCTVLSVDYRRPPEHPYPAALDDVTRAIATVRGEGRPIVVAGDSAGGHLAAAAARRERDAGRALAAQVLICPVVSPAMDYPPLDEYGLHRDEMRFFWDVYAPVRTHADLDLLAADLRGLPPAIVISAGLDILGPEADRYAEALLAAGVPTTAVRYAGLPHNFPRKLAVFDAARAAIAQIAALLPSLLD
ncbi:alpha/beta hydrolase [Catenuloplanes atrovinosus]|uniref:Acetyl esterase n=1 Tax=Catenuloplanes atrovinosus TaxID=137266 RepID=A0AAE3YLL8_9ACTN|nr:alpha/beta hydrolase [Catenuloplanes atrovinosus]MDR7274488.1 acetyl esterase [Catenuloplanes atrovinosus]